MDNAVVALQEVGVGGVEVGERPRAEVVAEAMRQAKCRQREVARELGISPSHMCLILKRARMPSFPVAKKLAARLGVTMEELYGEVVVEAEELGAVIN
jgi:transcriptional regulator with XRE-family HTH domain